MPWSSREPRAPASEALGTPRFLLKGSFKGDIGIDIDVDMDVDIDIDLEGLVCQLSNWPYGT